MLKPQDVVLMLKLISKGDSDWSQGSLAGELCMSPSEINGGIKRARACGFLDLHDDGRRHRVRKQRLKEFMLSGLKYVFPAQRGQPSVGMVTAEASDIFHQHLPSESPFLPVWPVEHGKFAGYSLQPLYPSVPRAAANDPVLHDLLAIADVLRDWENPHHKLAQTLLTERLSGRAAAKMKKVSALESKQDDQMDLL